jgi:hypothetical protein
MENTDIIVLTTVIAVLFLVFIIAVVRELNEASEGKFVNSVEGGPRADLMRYIGSIFTDNRIDEKRKIELIDALKNVLTDSEKDTSSSDKKL